MHIPGWSRLPRPVKGVLLTLVGVVGLILPILPGWIFLIPGLLILSDYYPPLRRFFDWLMAKPRVRRGVEWARWRGEPREQGAKAAEAAHHG